MTLFQAKQLLTTVAYLYKHEKESFSKAEIISKINEIKYLSAQKKVPKLSLRKEIIHLESQLQGIFELERKMLYRKKRESAEVTSLKKRISQLQKKLELAEDKKLKQRVEKLSHLLGDYLAHYGSQKEIEQMQALLNEPKKVVDTISKVVLLQEKLADLKQKVAQYPESTALQDRIKIVEQKLAIYGIKEENPEPEVFADENISNSPPPMSQMEVSGEIKHDVLFDSEALDLEIDQELPLPPPPRIRR